MKYSEENFDDLSPRVAKLALQFFFGITDKWQLTNKEESTLLGNPSIVDFNKWKDNIPPDSLNQETLRRIMRIMNIFYSLQELLPTSDAANHWIKKPNSAPLFGGDTALNFMLSGGIDALVKLEQYLYGQCH